MTRAKINLIAWSMYDWASSSFPVVVSTFIFATYFTSTVAENEIIGTYHWANAAALAGIIVGILSPIFGSIADYSGRNKVWLGVFSIICIVASALLWFALPNPSYMFYTLACVVVGTVALEIAAVFYNSYLPFLAPPDYIGRISGWAWGVGYIGGIVLLATVLFGFINSPPSWLDTKSYEQIRICGPFVAAWFFLFSLPLFLIVPDVPAKKNSMKESIVLGLLELKSTLASLPSQKNLAIYLLSHLVYIDGLNTLFAFGGVYAAGTFGMGMSEIILLGISMNIAAGIGAISLAWIDDYLGSKPTILISILGMIIFGAVIGYTDDKTIFWIAGLLVTLFVGPVQAASRSLLVRLTPKGKTTEMFGIYAFSGRIASFLGPWALGWAVLYFETQRAGVAAIMAFFVVGGAMMFFVKEPPHPREQKVV